MRLYSSSRAANGLVPSVFAMPKRYVLDRRVGEMVLRAFTLCSHAREPERVELGCVLVNSIVVVRGVGGRGDERVLRDERPINQRNVFEGLACDRGCSRVSN